MCAFVFGIQYILGETWNGTGHSQEQATTKGCLQGLPDCDTLGSVVHIPMTLAFQAQLAGL